MGNSYVSRRARSPQRESRPYPTSDSLLGDNVSSMKVCARCTVLWSTPYPVPRMLTPNRRNACAPKSVATAIVTNANVPQPSTL
jgi:hypothetical protein